jgi:integrative and conjugative element protein (TIGR02256 family)
MYFGEWHTHHQDNPYYSFQDLTNWKKLMKKSETSTDLLVFLIAGISSFKIWIGDRTKITIRQIYEGDYSGFKMD